MNRPARSRPALSRAALDDLAARVAADLEAGDLAHAWARTRELERLADPAAHPDPAVPVPPWPVIGRRFAAAHRRLRSDIEGVRRVPAA